MSHIEPDWFSCLDEEMLTHVDENDAIEDCLDRFDVLPDFVTLVAYVKDGESYVDPDGMTCWYARRLWTREIDVESWVRAHCPEWLTNAKEGA